MNEYVEQKMENIFQSPGLFEEDEDEEEEE
jgi:hypothetical protein